MQCIRLDQNTLEIQAGQQLLEGSPLTGFTGVVGLLGQGDAEGTGVEGDLGDKPMAAIASFEGGAAQGLPVAHQLVQTLCPTRDLADHPGLQHLAVACGFCEAVLLQVGLVEQVEKGGIRGPSLVVQAQRLVESPPVPTRKPLQITGAAAAAEDAQHRHQQQKPLGISNPPTEPPIGDGLEEADQVAWRLITPCGGVGFGHGGQPFPPTEPHAGRAAKGSSDKLLGGPGTPGVNSDGRRELLCLKVGNSETEALWAEFISRLTQLTYQLQLSYTEHSSLLAS